MVKPFVNPTELFNGFQVSTSAVAIMLTHRNPMATRA